MKRFLIATLLLLGSIGTALAGQESDTFCFVSGAVSPNNWVPCSASTPLQIAGSISASLGGFTPSTSGARGTPFTVTTSDSSGTLPTGTVVIVSNPGANPMYCNVNGVAATTSDQPVAAGVGNWFAFTIPAGVTTLHCIATGGSTTANMVGGSGLATGSGGGGGSGGAVTIASGGVASGAYASGAFASGAFASGSIASGAVASGAIASGAIVDGADVTLGTKADAAWTSGSGTLIAIAKAIATNTGVAIPAGANVIGYVSNDPCAQAAKTNVAISTASGTTALVTGVSAKKIYVCSLSLIAPSAVSVSLAEGSSSTCGTSNQAAVIGVATNGTAANGMPLAANGGLTLGNGGGSIAITATAANYLCLFQSGTAQIAGNLTYVQQ
jgi:hypothetical protein